MSYRQEAPETIQNLFGSIAPHYDRTNALMSFSLHRRWNRKLVDALCEGGAPQTLLDLCCGTGEIAFSFLQQSHCPHKVYLLDFCAQMLAQAKAKAQTMPFEAHTLVYIEGDAQEIALPDNSVDAVSIAYGIRNVQDPARCIRDVYRVLRPGGRFGILELTRPRKRLIRWGHNVYLKTLLPLWGRFSAANSQAYHYLARSVTHFRPPEELCSLMREAQFQGCQIRPLTGGVATLLLGKKG